MSCKKIFLITLSPKTHRTSEENLGIEYLKSSLEEKGYYVEIIDAWLNHLEVDSVYHKLMLDRHNILFIGLSSYMSNTKPTIELISKLKKNAEEIPIVCGGFGPTFYPKEYLDNGADYVIRGEGEVAICELAKKIESQEEPIGVCNVSYRKNNALIHNNMSELIANLDVFPFPSRDNLDVVLKNKATVNMVSSRGCSGNCEFCSVISFFRLSNGKVWRTRSIKNIVDELEFLQKRGVTHVKMVDDSFIDGIRDDNWCEEFAQEIEKRQIKIKLRGQIRADKVTEGVLSNLKRAGFFSFACGIENGSITALSRMNKKATLKDNENALDLFKKYDYLVQMGFILFDRDTTIQELEDNYRFLKKYDFAVTKGIFSEMYSAEGTPLNSRLKKEHKLTQGDFLSYNNKYVINDCKAGIVYEALKIWHRSHSEIYDMTIDPLTAPKAISQKDSEAFYYYAMQLKMEDLKLFRKVLDLSYYNIKEIIPFVLQEMESKQYFYHEISSEVKKVYQKSGLDYVANKNPFI